MIKKTIYIITIIILTIISYNYLKPPFEIKNSEAVGLSYKVAPFRRDSIYVYIPYEIVIYNNRLNSLEISRVFDENYHEYRPNLLYNKDGIELSIYYSKSQEQYEYKLDYWFKTKYSHTIFPLTKRVFYYYRRHKLNNKNDVFEIRKRNQDSINRQLVELKYQFKIKNNDDIIDSLYTSNNLKIFNVDFEANTFTEKYIKAKINSNQQIAINVNYWDSVKTMTKVQKVEYLLKRMKTNTKLDDF